MPALRTRYTPSCRIRTLPFFVAVPWITLAVLVVAVFYVFHEVSLTPGLRVSLGPDGSGVPQAAVSPEVREFASHATELPETPFIEGAASRLALVVNPNADKSSVLVFFDDDCFNFGKPDQKKDFETKFGAKLQASRDEPAVLLFIDKSVSYGSVAELLADLRVLNVQTVHFATRTP